LNSHHHGGFLTKHAALGLAAASARGLSCLAGSAPANPFDRQRSNPLTVAVFVDRPYSATLLADAPLLLNSVNTDPDVRLAIHVGDIHSGSLPCSGAGLNPIPAGSFNG
jgi:hypothetical protein